MINQIKLNKVSFTYLYKTFYFTFFCSFQSFQQTSAFCNYAQIKEYSLNIQFNLPSLRKAPWICSSQNYRIITNSHQHFTFLLVLPLEIITDVKKYPLVRLSFIQFSLSFKLKRILSLF